MVTFIAAYRRVARGHMPRFTTWRLHFSENHFPIGRRFASSSSL
jgi:hypothetical protein